MEKMRFFVDTHDKTHKTFPESLTEAQLAAFWVGYEAACQAEGVVILQASVGLEAGRAFCMTMAPDAAAVQRAHDRVGLPFDSITEVKTLSPGALFLQPPTSSS